MHRADFSGLSSAPSGSMFGRPVTKSLLNLIPVAAALARAWLCRKWGREGRCVFDCSDEEVSTRYCESRRGR
jgi:hypothetical protein